MDSHKMQIEGILEIIRAQSDQVEHRRADDGIIEYDVRRAIRKRELEAMIELCDMLTWLGLPIPGVLLGFLIYESSRFDFVKKAIN